MKMATLTLVDWYNHRRLPEPIGDIPRAEAEANLSSTFGVTQGGVTDTTEPLRSPVAVHSRWRHSKTRYQVRMETDSVDYLKLVEKQLIRTGELLVYIASTEHSYSPS